MFAQVENAFCKTLQVMCMYGVRFVRIRLYTVYLPTRQRLKEAHHGTVLA